MDKEHVNELDQKDAEQITGGNGGTNQIEAYCENCKKIQKVTVYSGSRAICSKCGYKFDI